MSMSHKLRAVIRHEYTTIVKQPSFWISLFAAPVLIALIIGIGIITDSSDKNSAVEDVSIAVVDDSGVIDREVAESLRLDIKPANERAELLKGVQQGKLDGLVVYPENLQTSATYQVYSDNTDTDNGGAVSQLAKTALQQSLLSGLDSSLASLAISGGQAELKTYKNGDPAREFIEQVVPGAFLILFYIILVFSVGYALYSVSEEKENRSIEMVLSYVKPQTLITGKLLGIILVTLTQIAILAALGAVAYFIAKAFGNELDIPFDVSDLTFVPMELFIGTGFLIVGFIFYVALMAMVGAIFPSSKEAGSFSSVFFILPAVPFWGIDAIINDPSSTFAQVLTYFPLTSPTTVLLRNAVGNLSPVEGLISLAVLMLATVVAIYLASKAFKLGTLEYSERIKFSSLLK